MKNAGKHVMDYLSLILLGNITGIFRQQADVVFRLLNAAVT